MSEEGDMDEATKVRFFLDAVVAHLGDVAAEVFAIETVGEPMWRGLARSMATIGYDQCVFLPLWKRGEP
jgi:hypothetical protein